VLGYFGRQTGLIAIAGVNAFVLVTYLVYRRHFERIEATALEGLISWLLWTLLIGAATACYALDWRILGACVLALVLVMSFANAYIVVMRPDVADEWIRRARERDDEDDGPPAE
jgi:hypothetical protein